MNEHTIRKIARAAARARHIHTSTAAGGEKVPFDFDADEAQAKTDVERVEHIIECTIDNMGYYAEKPVAGMSNYIFDLTAAALVLEEVVN